MSDGEMATGLRPIPECYWVREGLLLAGEYPGHRRSSAARSRLARFVSVGIRSFIDLTEEWELNPYAAFLMKLNVPGRIELTHRRMPIPDLGVPSVDTMRTILDTIDASLAQKRPQYLHCWGGVGRTGTVVGCWLVRRGYQGPAALAQIDTWWQKMPKRDRHPMSPETAEQRQFVLDWRG